MNGWANIFPRMGFVFFTFLILAFALPSPVLADHDKTPPGQWEDRDSYFYEGVYPYRRHWHYEEIPPSEPLTRSEILKRKQERNRAKSLERGRALKEIQERNRAKSLERSRALKEVQERNKAKAQERSRALKEIQLRNRAKALERSRALKEIQERNKARALENRRR